MVLLSLQIPAAGLAICSHPHASLPLSGLHTVTGLPSASARKLYFTLQAPRAIPICRATPALVMMTHLTPTRSCVSTVKGVLLGCRLHRIQQDVTIIREQTTATHSLRWQTFTQGAMLGASAATAVAWLTWRASRLRQ